MTADPMRQTGSFVLSIDTELAWGCMDIGGIEYFRRDYEKTREIIDRLLDLLVEYEISAVWAIVGHLFLDGCRPVNGIKHPEITRANHSWWKQDWFSLDPATDIETDPLWYGRDIVTKIKNCPVPQEIASHSFSHVIFGDPGCSREAARSEVKRCVELALEMGITLSSFVFPRNSPGHLEVLAEQGFTCFRGEDPCWYGPLPRPVRKIAHVLDQFFAVQPPVVEPKIVDSGLVCLPGSQIYIPAHGFRRLIPVASRVKKAAKGLEKAVKEGKTFHLWFHPFNLARRTDALFIGLEGIFRKVTELRAGGTLVIRTMRETAILVRPR